MTAGNTTIVPRPYGTWESPITADFVVASTIGLDEVRVHDGYLYWLESRPQEGGRSVVVRLREGESPEDVTPASFNVRSRVNEYGGGAYVASDAGVFFSNFSDNALYLVFPGGEPKLISLHAAHCFGDLVYDKLRKRVLAICEDHSVSGHEPVTSVVAVDVATGQLSTLASGSDFYSSPRLSPYGDRLAWLTWNHPNMPWDGTTINVAAIHESGSLHDIRTVAGGTEESIFQPEWSPSGQLYFVSDRTGWWNLYRVEVDGTKCLWSKAAEFGVPQWVFGQTAYAFADEQTIVCTYAERGSWKAAMINGESLSSIDLDIPFSVVDSVAASNGKAYFIGASPSEETALVSVDLSSKSVARIKRSSAASIDPGCISEPVSIEFPTASGKTAHAIYYPPRNDRFTGPVDDRPPLLVSCHGGPTSASYAQLNKNILFWTSRGFAFALVNYGGSTGYGRDYRKRLDGNWGVVDVEDCVNAALWFAKSGLVDGSKMTIHGGSAGGYVAICALTFYDVFAAGASRYGISDLEPLALESHKFEARYMDRLVGPYPESKSVYAARSPINFAERLNRPIIFFQGLEDRVVPPSQAEKMVEILRSKGVPVAYLAFEGEGHGFRQSENIKRTLEAMLYFYGKVLDIPIADHLEQVEIF
jgi:acetyl esterase/lipase